MGNIFNSDFRDFLTSLNDHGVRYVLVGGYSVILHGYSRTTGDMDLWVERTADNYANIVAAFQDFGKCLVPVYFNHKPTSKPYQGLASEAAVAQALRR